MAERPKIEDRDAGIEMNERKWRENNDSVVVRITIWHTSMGGGCGNILSNVWLRVSLETQAKGILRLTRRTTLIGKDLCSHF